MNNIHVTNSTTNNYYHFCFGGQALKGRDHGKQEKEKKRSKNHYCYSGNSSVEGASDRLVNFVLSCLQEEKVAHPDGMEEMLKDLLGNGENEPRAYNCMAGFLGYNPGQYFLGHIPKYPLQCTSVP